MVESLYYTVEDIQAVLGCGRSKAYRLVALPTFPKIRIGRTFYIRKDEFEKWAKNNLYSDVTLLD